MPFSHLFAFGMLVVFGGNITSPSVGNGVSVIGIIVPLSFLVILIFVYVSLLKIVATSGYLDEYVDGIELVEMELKSITNISYDISVPYCWFQSSTFISSISPHPRFTFVALSHSISRSCVGLYVCAHPAATKIMSIASVTIIGLEIVVINLLIDLSPTLLPIYLW